MLASTHSKGTYPASLSPRRLVSEIAIMLYFLANRPHFSLGGYPKVPQTMTNARTTLKDVPIGPQASAVSGNTEERTVPEVQEEGAGVDKLEDNSKEFQHDFVQQWFPGDHPFYSRMISEYNRVAISVRASNEVTPDDECFLLQISDFLGDKIKPHSSESIAFSELSLHASFKGWFRISEILSVIARRLRRKNNDVGAIGEIGVVEDAEIAFPGYGQFAVRAHKQMRRYRLLALVMATLVFIFSMYLFIVSMSLTNVAEIRRQTTELERNILSKITALYAASGPAFAQIMDAESYCPNSVAKSSAAAKDSDQDVKYGDQDIKRELIGTFSKDPEYWLICNRWNDLRSKRDEATEGLDFRLRLFGLIPQTLVGLGQNCETLRAKNSVCYINDPTAATVQGVMNRCILPICMGMLGSIVFTLRNYSRKMRDRLLVPRDIQASFTLAVLGIVVGVVIGYFYEPSARFAEGPGGLVNFTNLSAPAVAFLAAYGVDYVLDLLDRIAAEVFHRPTAPGPGRV